MDAKGDDAVATDKAQAFAHRLVEFADFDACVKYFSERQIDFDRPNVMGWSVLMSVCACGRDDLVGIVMDQTTAVECATNTNRTTVLHLTAMSKNTRVMEELVATAERRQKLQKIIDQPNANGDTALMMACVAKNVVAVELLLKLGASLSASNASGLNALMCAARVGEDPRPGAPNIDEMMERSAVIVKMLLAHGVDVNAVETAGGNTALHLAVLSENPDAVESLIGNSPTLDVTLRNEAGNTALDLNKRISEVASAQMEDLLNLKWAQHEQMAAEMSAKMEQELMEMAGKETSSHKQASTAKAKKNKRTKKKAKASENTSQVSAKEVSDVSNDTLNDAVSADTDKMDISSRPPAVTTEVQRPIASRDNQTVPGTEQRDFEDDEGSWQSVLPKKSRRKEVASEKPKANPLRAVKKVVRHPSKINKKNTQAPPKIAATPTKPTQKADAGPIKPESALPKAPWSNQVSSSSAKLASSVSPRSQVTSEEDEDQVPTYNISYEKLNGSFQRTFPVAAELEIDVEKFLIASSVSDRELEPDDNLSISQVEALQEAHWQAYHYLNEKKIELTRVLEAQRVEAQFVLQQELMHLK